MVKIKRIILFLLILTGLLFYANPARADDVSAINEIKKLEFKRIFSLEKFKIFLSHPDEKIRKAAIIACGSIGNFQAVDLLNLKLEKETKANQEEIIFALGQLEEERSIPYLLKFINNTDPHLRALSVEALGKIGDSQLSYKLAEKLNDKDPEVRSAAAIALGKLKNGYAVPFLMNSLYNEEDKHALGCAAWSMQRYMPQWRQYPAARYSVHDSDGWVRLNSLKILEKTAPMDYLSAIDVKLIDDWWPVQIETSNYLTGQNKQHYIVPVYFKGLKDEKEIEKYINNTYHPVVIIEMEKGKIAVELFENTAPFTVYNFLKLVKSGFYNGLAFHRVIPGFVIQGGDPKGDCSGGPHYTIPDEINKEKHTAGGVSMAHDGKDTGGSQFFICHTNQPHLDGVHTVFGRVIFNQELVDQINQDDKIIKMYIYKPEKGS